MSQKDAERDEAGGCSAHKELSTSIRYIVRCITDRKTKDEKAYQIPFAHLKSLTMPRLLLSTLFIILELGF